MSSFLCVSVWMALPLRLEIVGNEMYLGSRAHQVRLRRYDRELFVGKRINVRFDGKVAIVYVKKYDSTVTLECKKIISSMRIGYDKKADSL